jgi:hypothetical protein
MKPLQKERGQLVRAKQNLELAGELPALRSVAKFCKASK